MKRLYIIIGILLFCSNSYAQIKSKLSTQKIVQPRGYYDVDALTTAKELPAIDLKKLLKEDEEGQPMGVPYRFATDIDVDYSSENSGKWFTKSDGSRIWKLKIHSNGALSISLIFSQLILPQGAEVYIYNDSRTMTYGPILPEHIKNPQRFSSDLILGNTIILELLEPKNVLGESYVEIGKVIHGYKNMFPPAFSSGYGASAGCEIDVNCYPYPGESDGVVMVLLANNTRHCSGALLNNGCQDFTPNILTAFHCVDIGNNGNPTELTAFDGTLSTTEENNVAGWMFRFQYKSPTCHGPEPPFYSWITYGAQQFISGWQDTDFALIRMDEIPGGETKIKYEGWSRNMPTHTRSYHHPRGDIMKFSYDNDPAELRDFNWIGTNGYKTLNYPADHFWDISFTAGGVEPGSSGGPLMDGAGRVVGQLFGGNVCPNGNGIYGRFDVSWDGSGADDERLSIWLTNDPMVETTNTIAIPYITMSGSDFVICTNPYVGINLVNAPPDVTHNIGWTVSPNLTIVSQGYSSLLVRYSGSQNGAATITANIGNNNPGTCPVVTPFTINVQAGPFSAGQVSVSGQAAACPGYEYTYTS